MKMIQKSQELIKRLQASQQQMLAHVTSLDDTTIALLDTNDDSVECGKAQRVARKIKWKRNKKNKESTDDNDTSEENNTIRRSPRFRKEARKSKERLFVYDAK